MYTQEEVIKETLEYFNGDSLAANVFFNKYCLKDEEGNAVELTPDDMHKRLAKEFSRIEEKFSSNRHPHLSYDQIYGYLKDFKYIVPQGSPMYGIGNDYVKISLSNCVVVESPSDNVSSIMDAGKDLANLFKRRCGVGLDISKLRPEGASVNNSARTTTGAWSFADFYSYVCRMIGQNGRRGALMISMDVSHPDIEKFIEMKHDLTKVTGANVSVKITDDFMEAVKSDSNFTLRWDSEDGKDSIVREVEAKKIWNMIVNSATKTAEPGILMWDNIIKNLPAHEYEQFKTRTTNPCGEIALSAYDSCRLISINMSNFVEGEFDEDCFFDYNKFKEVVRVAMRMSDDLVELELEKLNSVYEACDSDDERELWKKLIAAAHNGRRTGLGSHGLADCMAKLRLKYDSKQGIEFIRQTYEILRNCAYMESVKLASERGAFPVWDYDVEKENAFIKRLPKSILNEMKKFGRRNISILTNAPTGSVSIMSQTSSGIEPVFRNAYIRNRKLNHNEDIEPDFTDELGDKWVSYTVYHHNASKYFEKYPDQKELPDFFVESDQIDWTKRIEVQSALQENIDHCISSTINLPKETESEVVSELYMKGWEMGLKGITVYVDGSRTGVLVTDSSESEEVFAQSEAPKRPETLECDIHRMTIYGEKWTIFVGKLDGKPYEIMGGLSHYIEIPKKHTSGKLNKISRKTGSRYDLLFGEDEEETIIRDVAKVFDNPNQEILTRMVSLSLRHGAGVSFVVEQLKKDKTSDMFSFNKCLARTLKKYIVDGTKASSERCEACESKNMVYEDGCARCLDCGHAACG